MVQKILDKIGQENMATIKCNGQKWILLHDFFRSSCKVFKHRFMIGKREIDMLWPCFVPCLWSFIPDCSKIGLVNQNQVYCSSAGNKTMP